MESKKYKNKSVNINYTDGSNEYYCRLCKKTFVSVKIFGGHLSHCKKKYNHNNNIRVNLIETNFLSSNQETNEVK